jgi:hypothetical protein
MWQLLKRDEIKMETVCQASVNKVSKTWTIKPFFADNNSFYLYSSSKLREYFLAKKAESCTFLTFC